MSEHKPFKGTFANWHKQPCLNDDGEVTFCLVGTFVNHERFAGRTGHTSYIVKFDEVAGWAETRNSIYKLGEPYVKLEEYLD